MVYVAVVSGVLQSVLSFLSFPELATFRGILVSSAVCFQFGFFCFLMVSVGEDLVEKVMRCFSSVLASQVRLLGTD